MDVILLGHTPDALELLLYTKNTRLQGSRTMQDVNDLPLEEKMKELDYMFHTIQGAFEFVHYTFQISGISRATTHQLVRTRTASFQQESMRAVDARESSYSSPDGHQLEGCYKFIVNSAINSYAGLIDDGMPIQDARGVLPTAMHTSIVMKANLRTLAQMADHRLCTRTQGEYQTMFRSIREKILAVHPWAEPLLLPHCAKTGLCAFPNYKDCPIQKNTIHPTKKQLERIHKAWESTDHEANPVAKNGRTM